MIRSHSALAEDLQKWVQWCKEYAPHLADLIRDSADTHSLTADQQAAVLADEAHPMPVEWFRQHYYDPQTAAQVVLPTAVQVETAGCYPGCFYYTDSCFRADCKQKANPTWCSGCTPDNCGGCHVPCTAQKL